MKNYEIPPSFIDSAESHRRQFQAEMEQFANDQTKRVAIVSAPTGSGKTHGFRLMRYEGKTIVVVFPNNLLSRETMETFRVAGIDDVVLLNASSINAVLREKKKLGFHDFTRRKAIGLILENKKYVITNPTIFYNMLGNRYSEQSKEDMLSELLKNNLSTIIFDEFHIYSRDQASMILASTLLLRSDIKLMFASATIPDYLPALLKDLFGEEQLKEILVERLSQRKENSVLLQGKLNVHIIDGTAVEFIRNNHALFQSGRWFLILDSIRNIHEAKRDLMTHIPQSEILVISAYDDPSYEAYDRLKKNMIDKRIIIGSNIVEQGINPPINFTNFLIEPGYSPESIIQRTGRIGRGTSETSELYIAIQSSTVNFPDLVETVNVLFDFVKSFRFRSERPPWVKSIGAYLWFILDRLTGNAKEAVLDNLKNTSNASLLAACFSTGALDRKLSNRFWVDENSHYVSELVDIFNWWIDYKDSIYQFIPTRNEIKALDSSEEFAETGGLVTNYSKLWFKVNKEIVELGEDYWIVKDFLKKPDFDFAVYVSGLPFHSKVKMNYRNVYFSARKEIIDRFKSFYKSYFGLPNEMKETIESLGDCIVATAGPERLRLELI